MESHLTFEVVIDSDSDKPQKRLAAALKQVYRPEPSKLIVRMDGQHYDISRLRYHDPDVAVASLTPYLAEHKDDAVRHFLQDAVRHNEPVDTEVYDALTATISAIYPFAGGSSHSRLICFIVSRQGKNIEDLKHHVLNNRLGDFVTEEQKRMLHRHCIPDIIINEGIQGFNRWQDLLGYREAMTEQAFRQTLSLFHMGLGYEGGTYPIPIKDVLEMGPDLTASDLLDIIIGLSSDGSGWQVTPLKEDWVKRLSEDESCHDALMRYCDMLTEQGDDDKLSRVILEQIKGRPEGAGRRNAKQRI